MGTKPQTKNVSAIQPGAMRNLVDIAEAILIDLPIAAAKRVLVRTETDELELNQATWKAYDAAVKLADDATSSVYTSSLFGRVAAGAMDFAVRAQRLNVALSGALFANLWPALGLPAATEITAMRNEVEAMRAEVADARAAGAASKTAIPAPLRDPRDNPRFDVETAMMATSGVFQRPIYTEWTLPEGRGIKANVSN
ncbi:MAG: hypothetical protein ACYDC3_01030 [Candidatus Binataceae bacterium]